MPGVVPAKAPRLLFLFFPYLMFIEQPSVWLRWLYPMATWRMNPSERAVYLTFDDGPIPRVTPWVLDVLDHYGVKATFFMVGDNVRKHPAEFEMVRSRGHRLGNHTFNHIGGLRHGIGSYMRNVEQANELLQTDLFRPPHGWMKWGQYIAVRMHYRVIMWDLVTRDYSTRLNGRDVLLNVRRRLASARTSDAATRAHYAVLRQMIDDAIEHKR